MQLPTLYQGQLLKRYKRFLADIHTDNGDFTAHCPNTGAMTGCAEPGRDVWFSLSDNPKRKYAATWELVDTGSGICSVNTGRANKLVAEAITTGVIDNVGDVASLKPEIAIPQGNGRFDFGLQDAAGQVYIEVKSVTLVTGDGHGAFPDAVSSRAKKHVDALRVCVAQGHRGVLIFCAQHTGIDQVSPAFEIDPAYACALKTAQAAGVEIRAYGCQTDLLEMTIDRSIALNV